MSSKNLNIAKREHDTLIANGMSYHLIVAAEIELAIKRQLVANGSDHNRSDIEHMMLLLEFGIYKLNAFGTRATKSQKLFYLRVVVSKSN